jgi:hypothetical protein
MQYINSIQSRNLCVLETIKILSLFSLSFPRFGKNAEYSETVAEMGPAIPKL